MILHQWNNVLSSKKINLSWNNQRKPGVFAASERGRDGGSFQGRCGGLIRESYPWQSRQLLQKQGIQSNTLGCGLFIIDMNHPLIHSSDHIKWFDCDNADTIVNSSPFLRFNIEWMIISFPLLSLSLTCRNGQFMQAAPRPGKVDAPQRRKAAMFQTMKMNSGTTQGWFRSWATWI